MQTVPRKPASAAAARSETAFSRLVADYLQDRRAGGASAKTVAIYADALSSVLLPFCATRKVSDPAQLNNRLLNDLGSGLLDGSLSRTRRPLSKATVHSYMRAVNTFVAWATARRASRSPPRPNCRRWPGRSSTCSAATR